MPDNALPLLSAPSRLAWRRSVSPSQAGVAARVEVVSSLDRLSRAEWDACFRDEVEGYDYLLAVERAGLKGFDWAYVVARDETGRAIAAMPGFLSDYGLETTLDHPGARRAIQRVRRVWPRFLTMRLACLGSPCTETGAVGFHPSVPEGMRADLLGRLIDTFEGAMRARGATLFALKDIPATWPAALQQTIAQRGYAALAGLPTARLPVDFADMPEYLARLSKSMRKDLRRKLKARDAVQVMQVRDLGFWREQAQALYLATRARSDWQFEELTEAYFQGLLDHMPGRAFAMLYFVEGRLIATNFLIEDPAVGGGVLIDKFFCMDAERGRPWSLYYLSWITNIEYCLSRGYRSYQTGQAYYHNKLRLGSRLTPNTMYFRHRNRLVQRALRLVSPLFAADEGTADGPGA